MIADDRRAAQPSPIKGGVFVAVVGASGAGKDTLINHAKDRFEGETTIVFARRAITRASDRSREDHDTLSGEEFERRERDGGFALSWEAHGLRYGIPASTDEAMRGGKIVVANLSRGAIPRLRRRYGNVRIVLVTATPETLARRLAARDGESGNDLRERIARGSDAALAVEGAHVIENDGTPEEAGESFVSLLRRFMGQPTHQE